MTDEDSPTTEPDTDVPGPADGAGTAVAVEAGASDDGPARAEGASGESAGETPPALGAGPPGEEQRRREARRTRLVLPLLIPAGAILAVGFYVLNVSRVFLAAAEGDSTPAVIIAAGITVAILGGATAVSAMPRLRTSSLVVMMSGLMMVVLLAGSVVLGASAPEKKAKGGYTEPSGPPVNALEVDALPTLRFQATSFTAPAGINLIHYVDKGGTHTLVFGEPELNGFELQVPTGKNTGKVLLKPGKSYTIFCTIPGHRQAGMEATITVGAAPAGAATAPKGGATGAGSGGATTTTKG